MGEYLIKVCINYHCHSFIYSNPLIKYVVALKLFFPYKNNNQYLVQIFATCLVLSIMNMNANVYYINQKYANSAFIVRLIYKPFNIAITNNCFYCLSIFCI